MTFTVGLVQLCSTRDMHRNLVEASALIRQAKASGAEYVLTPEMTNIVEDDRQRLKSLVMTESEDSSVKGFSVLAKDLGLWLHIGSLALKTADDKIANRSLLFSPEGDIVARYDKIHLFDVTLPSGEQYCESASFEAGQHAVVADLPWARLGCSICYDVRFPQLYNALATAGANVMAVPAAFTVPTGQAHWHVLLKARAIETGSFVMAAAQTGQHESGRRTYGHSLIVNPWGEIVVEAGTDPTIVMAEIDPSLSARDRARIPALANARQFSKPLA